MVQRKMTKCYICEKGNLLKKKINYNFLGINIGLFDAEVCTACGQTFFEEQASREITEKTKKLGLWGLESKTKIGKVGSALDIRFSKRLVDFLDLKKGEEVTIYPENKNNIRIELVPTRKYSHLKNK